MGFFGHRKRPLVVRRHDDETTTTKSPFDAFLSAAISAILAVFFAWRVFFFAEKRAPSIEAASSSESDSEDDEKTLSFVDDMSDFEETKKDDAKSPLKSVSTLLETDSLPSSSRPAQAPPPIPAFDPDELTAAIEKIQTPPEQSPEYKINTFGVLKDLEDEDRKKALESLFESGTPPEDWPGEQADFMVFTGPGLVQFMSSGSMDPSNFGYLDAITEEDSDDLRSHSSASSHRFGSARSSVRAPSADVVEQVDNRISQILENLDEEKTPTSSRRESGPEILSEASESLPESETTMHPRISQVKIDQEKQMADLDRDQAEILIQNPSVQQIRHFQPEEVGSPSVSIDFDNSRDSLLDQSVCSNPQDETAFVSKFVMDSKNDDQQQQFLTPEVPSASEEKHDESFDSEGYPPPPLPQVPPPEDDTVEEIHVLEKIKEVEPTELLAKPTIPADSEVVIDATDEEVRLRDPTATESESPDLPKPTAEAPTEEPQVPRKPPADLSSPERLSSLLYGYNGGLSPLYWQTRKLSPDENKENTKASSFRFGDPVQTTLVQPVINESSYSSVVGPNYLREERTTFQKETFTKPALDVEFDRSSKRLARYGPVYADAPLSYSSAFDGKDSAMEVQTSDVPPPLTSQPTTQRTYAESTGYRTDADTSRDDLMSDGGRRSRTTIREIPVHRSQSAFSYSRAPTTNGGSIMDIKTIGAGGTGWTTVRHHDTNVPPGEEYYRREVMTRTLVTRSTEALSQQPQPPLSRSPIDVYRYLPESRDEITEEYITKYSRSVEEEERRIRENQEKRRQEEEERRRREEEIRRRFDQEENLRLEKIRREKMRIEKDLEEKIIARERIERDRVERERREREEAERKRRQEWERLENERRAFEEQELARRRDLERLEKERLERERLEAERLEKERLARERAEIERLEMERLERERIERERIETERLEIERIERIKRERIERERRDREREQRERERIEQERLEAERLERERIERERLERELIEQQRREAEQRERERLEDEMKEMMRREQEARERELILQAEREAQERERQRRLQEQREKDRLEAIRREQERLERERQDAERRERERGEAERRERELLAAKEAARMRREKERIEEEQRERERLEQERLERERRERERREAIERERLRQLEEQKERDALLELERIAAERRAQRELEERRAREREALERETEMLREQERLEAEKRERERLDEERRLAELKELERRNAAQRDAERREAAEREAARRRDDRRSRERLDLIVKEREDREKWEMEKKRLLAEREAAERKRKDLTSRETLERLTRKPYYSRENLSGPEVTTKVERQVIERVDRTLYTSDGQPITTTSYFTGGGSSTNPPLEHYSGDDLIERDRLFQSRNDDLRDSKRAGRYRSRVEKDRARRDFFSADSSQNDPFERLRKSTEDLSRRVEYRGPLLSKFNSGEFSTNRLIGSIDVDSGYPRVGPGQYDKRETDDLNRSRSVLDYNSTVQQETTTRRGWYSPKADGNHTRSKSVDMLMDQRAREDSLAPENGLQKQENEQISEHEMRFRKSVEKLSTPDWYKDYSTKQQSYSTTQQRYDLPSSNQPWSYTNPPLTKQTTPTSPPVGGINFPSGMFDKYKDEIEDMRRSRTSLHQIGQSTTPQEHTKDYHIRGSTELLNNMPSETAAITREFSQETTLRKVEKTTTDRRLPGYTVSTVPSDWDLGKDLKVVEVADTFIGKQQEAAAANKNMRYGGRVTVEEALDTIFQQTKTSNNYYDTSLPQSERPIGQNIEGPGIYTSNYMLMDKVIEQPYLAEDLLSKEPLFVRCGRCHKTKSIKEARGYYVSCKHCYTYYCSRQCRQLDWDRHRDRCSFARINTLCKDVIMKVRQDAETQYHMSRVARDGYKNFGRGSVNIRLMSAHAAQQYLIKGWKAFENLDHTKLLFYYPVDALIDQGKEQSLITLCRKYNPNDKFILSVSIIADIEFCPETPPPEDQNQRQRYDFPPNHRSQPDIYSALVPTDV